MKVFKSVADMQHWSDEIRRSGKSIGLVPTMGFLHKGHLSLIRSSLKKADLTVVSIFVNPTQFDPHEDFDAYPRDFNRDVALCKAEGVDIIFAPKKTDMFPQDHQTFVNNDYVSHILCGKSRPTHFKGVTTIVSKLFNIVDPDLAIFGQKDAQQAIILKNMARDLNFRTRIMVEPIIRENDGLAMSSRNKYLSQGQRKNALVIFSSLKHAEQMFASGYRDTVGLKKEIVSRINSINDCKVDYVEFVNSSSLQQEFKKGDKVLLALAVFVGTTRLIDNIILNY